MPIPKGHRANFGTLQRAGRNGDLALMECQSREGGRKVYVICAARWDSRADEIQFTPLAKMFDGNPYEEVIPPAGEKV